MSNLRYRLKSGSTCIRKRAEANTIFNSRLLKTVSNNYRFEGLTFCRMWVGTQGHVGSAIYGRVCVGKKKFEMKENVLQQTTRNQNKRTDTVKLQN